MTGRGLGAEYYDSPQKYVDRAAAAVVVAAVGGALLAGPLRPPW